jgi:hypothetical protein
MENNQLTPKQRAKIYLKAAKCFQKQLNWFNENSYMHQTYANLPTNLKKYEGRGCIWGFCDFIEAYTKNTYSICDFEEYNLFKKTSLYWFNRQDDRVNALLLSYQMALDATE